jgi:demethylmenaquinone methyltransferase/2-methoxy-6-polyprenyl-1,4-benzoquinol methylase
MSSLALMRFLESTPQRYDWGMRLITLGGATRVHEAIAGQVGAQHGQRVLEIGCGTGAVTERLASQRQHIVALDQNPDMLAIGRSRLSDEAAPLVEWREMTASEVDTFPADAFDAVVASFSLSEMAPHERVFVFREARRVLQNDGRLIIGDEVAPGRRWQRWLSAAVRLPQLVLAWVLAGSYSKPIAQLTEELAQAGFSVEREQRWRMGTLAVVAARKLP